jgi:hypothetical protein
MLTKYFTFDHVRFSNVAIFSICIYFFECFHFSCFLHLVIKQRIAFLNKFGIGIVHNHYFPYCFWVYLGSLIFSLFAFSRQLGKLKASRSPRSNVDLRKELQDFISEFGLPSDSVPSLKQLSSHGR